MKAIKITDNDLEYVRSLIENDIVQSASDTSFFREMKIEPKDFIDQMTALAKMFELDFSEIVRRNCSDLQIKRLQVLYDGKLPEKIKMHTARVQKMKSFEAVSDTI